MAPGILESNLGPGSEENEEAEAMSVKRVPTRKDAPSTLATLADAVNAPDRPFSDDDRILITEKGLQTLAAAGKEAR